MLRFNTTPACLRRIAPRVVAVERSRSARSRILAGACAVAALVGILPHVANAQNGSYLQTNLISNGAVPAKHTDPNLINPWGLSIGQDFWIDSPGSGLSLVTDASGTSSFNVTVPAASSALPHGLPAGTVYNSDTNAFAIPGKGSAMFLFGNLDGSIAAWNPTTTQAVTVANNSANHAAYTDIAIDKKNGGTFLLAANFAGGTIDVFDTNFTAAHLDGAFSDATIPQGFAPFGIHSIGDKIYVTYAQVDTSNGREAVGAGLGYVNVFDDDGNFVQRAVSQGNLNAPWGMALAPASFGPYGGNLLVGNFGDGVINAYDPTTFTLKGQLQDAGGKNVANAGLWEIVFGTGAGGAGDLNTLYIAAGINQEKDGVVAAITVVPSTGTPDFSFSSSAGTITTTRGQSGSLTLSLAASNGFSGPVTLSCSGLPTGDSCTFDPASVTLSGSTPSTVTVAVSTAAAQPGTGPYGASRLPTLFSSHRSVMLAFAGPLGLLALTGVRRKSFVLRRGHPLLLLCLVTFALTGCGSNSSSKPPVAPTPTPVTPTTTQFTVNATAGAITHTVNVSLTVN